MLIFDWRDRSDLRDRSDKPVSPLGNRLDVLSSVRVLAELSSKDRDVGGEITLFDEGIGPHGLHQVVLGHQFPAFLDQNQEHFHRLRCQRHGFIALEKKARFPIQAELAEFVNGLRLHRKLAP